MRWVQAIFFTLGRVVHANAHPTQDERQQSGFNTKWNDLQGLHAQLRHNRPRALHTEGSEHINRIPDAWELDRQLQAIEDANLIAVNASSTLQNDISWHSARRASMAQERKSAVELRRDISQLKKSIDERESDLARLVAHLHDAQAQRQSTFGVRDLSHMRAQLHAAPSQLHVVRAESATAATKVDARRPTIAPHFDDAVDGDLFMVPGAHVGGSCLLNPASTCRACTTSLNESFAEFKATGELHIHSVATECRRKIVGGDIWIVRILGTLSSIRIVAIDFGNGSYSVPLPQMDEDRVQLRIELWWSSGARFDEAPSASPLQQWWDMMGTKPMNVSSDQPLKLCILEGKSKCATSTGGASPCAPGGSHACAMDLQHGGARTPQRCWIDDHEHGLSCRAELLAGTPIFLRAMNQSRIWPDNNLQPTGCTPGRAGRFVTAEACLLSNGPCNGPERLAAAVDPTRLTWKAFGCQFSESVPCMKGDYGLQRCLGKRRLLLMGDSMSRGTFLDLCVMLGKNASQYGGGCAQLDPYLFEAGNEARADKSPEGFPAGAIVAFAPVFGDRSYRSGRGLMNLLSSTHTINAWERFLTRLSFTTVVMGSGMHDLSIDAISRHTAGNSSPPMAAYEEHLCEVVELMKRVRAANPTILFIWRTMTHQLLTADSEKALGRRRKTVAVEFGRGKEMGFAACKARGHIPGTLPALVSSLNTKAIEVMGQNGIQIWHEPTLLTMNAPSTCFADFAHHDACTHTSAQTRLSPLKALANCEKTRMAGFRYIARPHEPRYRGWAASGGLSEAITDTLIKLLFS